MDFALPKRSVALRLIGGEEHYREVITPVLAARTSVWIATANLKQLMVPDERPRAGRRQRYRSVLEMLDALARRGVELRVLHAALPSQPFREAFDRHERLVQGGLELRLCPRVHFKAVIVDGALLYLGSANWTGAGLGAKGSARRNFELGVITDDTVLLDEVQRYYDEIWSGRACAGCQRRDVCEAPLG